MSTRNTIGPVTVLVLGLSVASGARAQSVSNEPPGIFPGATEPAPEPLFEERPRRLPPVFQLNGAVRGPGRYHGTKPSGHRFNLDVERVISVDATLSSGTLEADSTQIHFLAGTISTDAGSEPIQALGLDCWNSGVMYSEILPLSTPQGPVVPPPPPLPTGGGQNGTLTQTMMIPCGGGPGPVTVCDQCNAAYAAQICGASTKFFAAVAQAHYIYQQQQQAAQTILEATLQQVVQQWTAAMESQLLIVADTLVQHCQVSSFSSAGKSSTQQDCLIETTTGLAEMVAKLSASTEAVSTSALKTYELAMEQALQQLQQSIEDAQVTAHDAMADADQQLSACLVANGCNASVEPLPQETGIAN